MSALYRNSKDQSKFHVDYIIYEMRLEKIRIFQFKGGIRNTSKKTMKTQNNIIQT